MPQIHLTIIVFEARRWGVRYSEEACHDMTRARLLFYSGSWRSGHAISIRG